MTFARSPVIPKTTRRSAGRPALRAPAASSTLCGALAITISPFAVASAALARAAELLHGDELEPELLDALDVAVELRLVGDRPGLHCGASIAALALRTDG